MKLTITPLRFIAPAFYNDHHIATIPAGRQTSKTWTAVQWLCEETMALGCASLWVDTVQANIDSYIERHFQKILKPIWNRCDWNGQRKLLSLPSGLIDFGSAQKPENLEGFNYKRAVLNEGGIILKKASLWDNTIYPMVKSMDSQTRIIGTPKGRNKFYSLDLEAKHTNASFHYTVYDSPLWSKEEIERTKKSVPEHVWLQEYMAEFLEDGGMVFRGVDGILTNETEKKNVSPVMGIDLAKHEDYTVIVVMDQNTGRVLDMYRDQHLDWTLQKKIIFEMWKRLGEIPAIIDASGVGDAIYDDLVAGGMSVTPFKFTNSSKNALIENLIIAIQNKDISIPNVDKYEMLIDELKSFEMDVSRTGMTRYNAPEGLHDDCVIALALAWELARSYEPLSIGWV